jgi:hypothetical protein
MTPSLSPVHWLVIVISLAIFGIPAAVILKRAGYHPAWVLVSLIPGGALVGLWIFAFARWPVLIDPDAPPPPPKKQWGPA